MHLFYKPLNIVIIFTAILASCTSQKTSLPYKAQIYKIENLPKIGTTSVHQDIFLGGFSSLSFIKKQNSLLYFFSITDRGPNAEVFDKLDGVGENARPFLLPEFSPLLVEYSLDLTSGHVKIEKQSPFYLSKNKKMPGFPPLDNSKKELEAAVGIDTKLIKYSHAGMDSEGFCQFNDTFIVSEEYGPDLLQFDKNQVLLHRWAPGKGLPEDFHYRKMNRGLEGLACDNQFAYVMLQSPLKNSLDKDKDHVRLIVFDPNTQKTIKEYFYPVQPKTADKIGDITLIEKQKFLIIEQNGKLGSEKGVRKIYQVDLLEADSQGRLKKNLVVDLNTVGFDFVEKIEGIALVDANTIAVVSDNDFGIESHVDVKTGKVPIKKDPAGYLVIIKFENKFK